MGMSLKNKRKKKGLLFLRDSLDPNGISTLESQGKGQTQSRDSCRSNAQFGTNPRGRPYILSYLAKLTVPTAQEEGLLAGTRSMRHKSNWANWPHSFKTVCLEMSITTYFLYVIQQNYATAWTTSLPPAASVGQVWSCMDLTASHFWGQTNFINSY